MVSSILMRLKTIKEMRWKGRQDRELHYHTVNNMIGKVNMTNLSHEKLMNMSFDEIVNYTFKWLREKGRFKDSGKTEYVNMYSEREVDIFALNCHFEDYFDLDLIKELDLNFVEEFKKTFYYYCRERSSVKGLCYRSHRWMKCAPDGFFNINYDWRKIKDKYQLFRWDFESTFSKMTDKVETTIFLNHCLEHDLNCSRNEIESLEAIFEIMMSIMHECRHLCQMPGIDSIEELKAEEFANKFLKYFKFIPKVKEYLNEVSNGYTSEYDACQFSFECLEDLIEEELSDAYYGSPVVDFLENKEDEKNVG